MDTERSERRTSSRHRIALPVLLGDARGTTRDVSASGVFFTLSDRSTRPPELHEPVRFQLTLEHADPQGPLHIGCEGRVVRLDLSPDGVGVAVSISSHDFRVSEVLWRRSDEVA